jgi:hypothetical protein
VEFRAIWAVHPVLRDGRTHKERAVGEFVDVRVR